MHTDLIKHVVVKQALRFFLQHGATGRKLKLNGLHLHEFPKDVLAAALEYHYAKYRKLKAASAKAFKTYLKYKNKQKAQRAIKTLCDQTKT